MAEQSRSNIRPNSQLNEWLMGSTIVCTNCGCVWLVPALQNGEKYRCRQCGDEVIRSLSLTKRPRQTLDR